DHIAASAKGVEGLAPRGTPKGAPYEDGTPKGAPDDDGTKWTPRDDAVGHRFSGAHTQFSGLETLTIRPDANFQMIGERTNVTGSLKFARLIKAGDWAAATEVALDQVRGGANLIDVNMDEGLLDSEHAMNQFLNYID